MVGSEAVACLANRAALADLRPTGRGYGPLRPKPTSAASRCSRCRRASATSRSATSARRCRTATRRRWRSTAWRAFRGPRGSRCPADPQQRGPQLRRHAGGVPGRPRRRTTRARGGGTTTLVYDERRRRLVRRLRLASTARRSTAPAASACGRRSWLTGEETVAGPRRRRPSASPSATATCSRCRSTAGPSELETGAPITATGRFSHEAVGHRPAHRHRLRDRGPRLRRRRRLLPLPAARPATTSTAGGALQMLAVARPAATSTCARASSAAGRCRSTLGRHRRARSRVRRTSTTRAARSSRASAKGGAQVQPARGLLGGRRDDLLRLHQRRRRQERRREPRRLRRGLRPGLGVPARRPRRDARRSSTSRPAASELDSPDNLTVTPRGGLIVCEDDASRRRRHAPAGAGHRERQPADRHHAPRRARSSSRSTSSTAPSWPACASARAARRCSSTSSARAAASPSTPVEGMTCAVTGPWRRGPL